METNVTKVAIALIVIQAVGVWLIGILSGLYVSVRLHP